MKRSLLAVIVVCALSACASDPQTIIKTVEVKVPVPVPCRVDSVEKPAFALDSGDIKDPFYNKGARALAEIRQRQAYEARLEAAIRGCQ